MCVMHLKRLLEQRWTGHLATVSVIPKSFNDLTSLLTETDTVPAFGTKVRMEAVGLLRQMTEPSFLFIANLVHTVLALLDPNKLATLLNVHGSFPRNEPRSEITVMTLQAYMLLLGCVENDREEYDTSGTLRCLWQWLYQLTVPLNQGQSGHPPL
ncbi:hypothetical protein ABVT39_021925 [Epinephelus coioides]